MPLGVVMDQDFADTLRNYLIQATTWLLPGQREGASWVMSQEWFDEVRNLVDFDHRPLLDFPVRIMAPIYIFGYPIIIREDAGAPILEPQEE